MKKNEKCQNEQGEIVVGGLGKAGFHRSKSQVAMS